MTFTAIKYEHSNFFFNYYYRTNGKLVTMKKTIAKLKIGDIVTYHCYSITSSGLPKKPTIVKKRSDIEWQNIFTKIK